MENNKKKIKGFIYENNLILFLSIGFVLFIVSMLVTIEVRINRNDEKDIQKKYNALEDEYNNLLSSYKIKEEMLESYLKGKDGFKELENNNKNLLVLSGMTDVKGEGIVITLNDGEKNASSSRNDTIVHDSDILSIVNELKVSGAEAISVNDERIIATSAIRCVGPVIQVNYSKIAAPFVIKAIGNKEYLYSALNIENGACDALKSAGISVNVEKKDVVEISKYTQNYYFRYAK